MIKRIASGLMCLALVLASCQVIAAEPEVRELGISAWEDPGPGFFSEGLAPVRRDGKWGYIDSLGRLLIPCVYDEASGFSEGLARVKKDGLCGAVNTTGKLVVALTWDDLSGFSDGLCAVVKNGKTGFIDKTGKTVIEPQYSGSGVFKEGKAVVAKDKKYGFIDKTGRIVIPLDWDYAYSFSEGYAMVMKDGKVGFVDSNGTIMISPVWDDAMSFSGGFAAVMTKSTDLNDVLTKTGDKSLWEYINTSGSVLGGKKNFDSVTSFKDGLAVVSESGLYGVMDITGNYVVKPKYSYISMYNEGYAVVQINDKYGYLDESGNVALSAIYDFAGNFSDGLAPVIRDSLWGYIDTRGSFVVSPQYNDASIFVNGYAYVKKSGKSGFVSIKSAEPVAASDSDFNNISSWALPEIKEAFLKNLCGPVMNVDLTKPVTREKFCEIVVRMYEGLSGKETEYSGKNPFTDTRNPEILKAYGAGIVNGRAADKFVPDANITREEICVMLKRAVDNSGANVGVGVSVDFTDKGKVSSWAAPSVDYISAIGVVNGVGGNRFAPQDNTTIEQSLCMGLRMLKAANK